MILLGKKNALNLPMREGIADTPVSKKGAIKMDETKHVESQIDAVSKGSPSLTPIDASRIKHEAALAAAARGGVISLRGREIQPKASAEEPQTSPIMEGLLRQISEEVTHRAQVLQYLEQGLTKPQIIKMVWGVEEGSLYEEAGVQYEEIVGSRVKKTR
jgi:hypothetical protein